MNKFILILLFLFSNSVMAEEFCPVPTQILPTIVVTQTVDIAEKQCEENFDDNYSHYLTGCLSGGWKAGASLVDGLVELTKLLVIEAPKWIWNETKKKIDAIRQQDLSPFETVKAIANIQVASHSDIFNKAQEYWNTFLEFGKNLKDTLMAEIEGFPCLPKFKQSEIICRGVSEVFLTLFTPAGFINGARWTAATGKAVVNFVKESKKIHGLENADLATRLNRVTDQLRGGAVAGDGIALSGGVLKQVEFPDGSTVLQYTKQVVGKDGKTHTITREVPVDAKTKSIDANTEMGKEILAGMVNAQEGKGSLVFIDVNHLGKVNYFQGGTQTGDKYLESVSEALRKNLRPGDHLFKNGGDELVVIIKNNDPTVVRNISQRMIQEVDSHPEIRSIFRNEVKLISQQYKDLNKATSVDNLPQTVRASLSPDELAAAGKDFASFKASKLNKLKEDLVDQTSYRGSVSIGSSLIREGDDLATSLAKAENQASRVKAEYKLRLGHDIDKYKVTPEEFKDIKKWAPPQALDPN